MRRPNLTSCLAVMVFLLALASVTTARVTYINADASGADNAGGANGDTAVTVTASALKDIYDLGEQVPLVVTIVNYSAQPVYIYVDKDGFLRQTITVKDKDGVTITGEPAGTPPPPPRHYWVEIDGKKVFTVPVKEIGPGQTVTAVIPDALRRYHGHLQEGTYYLTPRDMSVIHDVGFLMERDDVPHPLWIEPSTVINKAKYKVNTVQIWLRRAIIYVDADATGANDGSSWADAYNYLQDALADANSAEKPVEIRVSQGIYKPDQGAGITPGDRVATFQLINDVAIRGGYAGFGEADPNARDIEKYKTILSGDLAENDIDANDPFGLLDEPSRAENSYHVATASNTLETAMLAGFTITGGNTGYERPSSLKMYGAGMYNEGGRPTLMGCTFTRNSAYQAGGGMYNSASSPTLIDCTFNINSAGYGAGICNFDSGTQLVDCTFTHNSARSGGGISNTASSPNLTNCTFLRNSALGGGGMSNANSNPILIECIFTGNSANSGGGMSDRSGRSTLIGCTFTENSAHYGGGMHDSEGSPTLTNCTFSGNSADYGGGVHHVDNSAQLINCAFVGNLAGTGGGGFGVFTYWGCEPAITNCTFCGNSAPSGSAVACYWWRLEHPSNLHICNSILADDGNQIWNNDGSKIQISYSNVQRGWTAIYDPCDGLAWGTGNIDADPLFVDAGRWVNGNEPNQIAEPNDPNAVWIDGDYHLKSQAGRRDPNSQSWVQDDVTSPCIDVGDMSSPIGFEPFPNGGIINMGAYGGTAEASKSYFGEPVCETIIAGDINGDCMVNFKDFALMSFHWLEDNTLLPPPRPVR